MKPFNDWLLEDFGQIANVKAKLKVPLSDDNAILQRQLSEIECWYGRITTLLAEANSYLDNAIARELLDIREGTQLEKKSMLDKAVSGERRIRDMVQGYTEAIKQRISLGQSLLRMQYEERFLNKNS